MTRERNWPRALVDHLGCTTADYVCHLRDGPRFEVRGGAHDRHIVFEILVEHGYPIPVSPGDIVVDIGAHIGCFTVWAARGGATIFSFEPCPANLAILERSVRLNDVGKNVLLFDLAVTGKREKRELYLPHNRAHSGRHTLHPGRGTQVVEVSCLSLDDILLENDLERIDVLKIDCEGSEYEILCGADPETLARTRTIIVECHPFKNPANWSMTGMCR